MESVGSTSEAIEAMRFSVEPCVVKFLATYDLVPVGDRDSLPLEAVIIKSGVNPNELLGATMVTYQALQSNKSAMRAMAAHPEIVAKTIEYAKEREGDKDRKMLHEAVRFLPTPRGQTFNFNLPTNAPPIPEKHESLDVESEQDINEVFPVMGLAKQNRWQENKNLLLKEKN